MYMAYNNTGRNIPVYGYYTGRDRYGNASHNYGGQIGYLAPGEQCTAIQELSYGDWRVGFHDGRGFRTDAHIRLGNQYGLPEAYNDYHRAEYTTLFIPVGRFGQYYRQGYNVFGLRAATPLYRRISSSFYMYFKTLYPGDAVGIKTRSYTSASAAYPWYLSIDAHRVGMSWDQFTDGLYADNGYLRGHTGKTRTNIRSDH